ncbi:hypothetical protein ACFX1S_031262 [Malus domestica]
MGPPSPSRVPSPTAPNSKSDKVSRKTRGWWLNSVRRGVDTGGEVGNICRGRCRKRGEVAVRVEIVEFFDVAGDGVVDGGMGDDEVAGGGALGVAGDWWCHCQI